MDIWAVVPLLALIFTVIKTQGRIAMLLSKPYILSGENGHIAIVNSRPAPIVIFKIHNQTGDNDLEMIGPNGKRHFLGSEPYAVGFHMGSNDKLPLQFIRLPGPKTINFKFKRIGWNLWDVSPSFNLIILPESPKQLQ